MICAGRKARPGFRAESWAEGRERREDGRRWSLPAHKLGSLWCGRAKPVGGTVSRGAAVSRKALRKPRFPLRGVRRRRFLRLRPGERLSPPKSKD